eukprot:Pgem_evm1s8256
MTFNSQVYESLADLFWSLFQLFPNRSHAAPILVVSSYDTHIKENLNTKTIFVSASSNLGSIKVPLGSYSISLETGHVKQIRSLSNENLQQILTLTMVDEEIKVQTSESYDIDLHETMLIADQLLLSQPVGMTC